MKIIGIISTILIPLCGLYAYQYYMRPEIVFENVQAHLLKITKSDDFKIRFTFDLKNTGNSKTKESVIYTAFLNWTVSQTPEEAHVVVSPSDFVVSDMFELKEDRTASINIDKYIKSDEYIKLFNTAEGAYCVVACQWQGDNIVFSGRTFNNAVILFLKPVMAQDRMVFNIQKKRQLYSTRWFSKDIKSQLSKLLTTISAKEMIYGDWSRFFE